MKWCLLTMAVSTKQRQNSESLKKRFTSLEIVTHAGRYGKSAALATGGRLARYPWLASL
jgi:hypothetical protein